MKFEDIQFEGLAEIYGYGAVQAKIDLANGYKLSIIKHRMSYGGEKGLFEIGVAHKDSKFGAIPEGWGDSVKGWLTEKGVEVEIGILSRSKIEYEKVRG